MDALINRDPMIHEFVLNEMENSDTPPRDGGQKAAPATAQEKLTKKLRSFFKQWHIVFSPINKVADVTIPVRGNHMEEVWTRSSLA